MRQVHEQVGHDCGARARLKGLSRRGALAGGLVALMALAMRSSAGTARADAPFGPWRAPLNRDHPLTGLIHDTRARRNISRAELELRLRAAQIAILGEVHDNPDHHRIQGLLLTAFAKGRGRPPAVVFEMIPTDMQKRLDSIMRVPELDADMIFDAVRWDESGWPGRDIYRPVMEAVARLRAPVIAAGLPRDDVRKATREGLDAVLNGGQQRRMQLAPLPEALMNAMVADIVKSHCDMIPQEVARRMSAAQRLRDALLADATRRGWRRQGSAVVITGNGHARADRAVPLYLRRYGDVPAPFVIWQAEASEKARQVADLLPEDARPPSKVADIIIVTPKAKREDPCAQFARFMRRKRNNKKQ